MDESLQLLSEQLREKPRKWLVTGAAGFIGSNLCEFLLKNNQIVVGLDNFSNGRRENIEEVKMVCNEHIDNFLFHEGDIRDFETCVKVSKDVDHILHQAALGSVPRSINSPDLSHQSNVDGTFNMLNAARQANVKSFVFASSSSVYGDNEKDFKIEDSIGTQLSPYAVTKHVCELYGRVFNLTYGLPTIGIRYFNVFGKRQDPNGAYAAVIPKWIERALTGKELEIYGDGETSRDFCYIDNVIQLNIKASLNTDTNNFGQIYNCALSKTTSLNTLSKLILDNIKEYAGKELVSEITYKDFRKGDIKNSQANISKSIEKLGYQPEVYIEEGIKRTVQYYLSKKENI
ncbi:NAD-dependent epimerase/dehydratase family protein [Halobacteriovorax vibrionivorans]|uniref:NAD-dependent epimerase/dehydratase family protein n=1 Tax=Halobacteriovorax vibrionivorans TaxID=2152716 RepID=A0ABY0IFD9_9BACT|nr:MULTISPECIES: NAD-dependent epimerase/dehydratase family protein [Halobacteriovorax]RZF21658.1 NAD-dependent epimerase/dehydratase family protein [Halobacteriovorax vibrionivorans]TGD49050.1 NAD-dependent epimerase/dehydratase family protein [Halobacteriovorax sp. Y22]